MTTTATGTGLTITDSALAKIREVMAQQELGADEKNLRVFVEGGGGGGCCGGGPSFGLAFDRAQDGDAKFEHGGMNVIIDAMSLPFCAGATIDYLDTPEVQGFKVNAPAMAKQESGGGCGGGSCGSGGGGGGGCGSGGGGCGCSSGAETRTAAAAAAAAASADLSGWTSARSCRSC
jgi:iron-sulfur cluster assembly accessory protein